MRGHSRSVIGVTPITGDRSDYDGLMARIGERRFVLIGEASHGTHDFYRERARITRRLIDEKGFTAVAVEADWPDAYRVNRWVRGQSDDADPAEALADFRRFPGWMWRNTDVVTFLQWLRAFNDAQAFDEAKVGFYGLDLYSMRTSMDAVVDYLQRHEPDAAEDARERYACFDLFQGEGQHYGHAVTMNYAAPCEEEVVQQLLDLRQRRQQLLSQDGWLAQDDYFFAEQNALLVRDAENYYRQMYRGSVSSWNLRDSHMGQTLEALVRHLESRRSPAKVVVWAHNSHVGDARHTQMGRHGELNIGQLVREAAGDDCVNVGFTTHHGQVTAATEWGGPAERKRVRRSLPGSYEVLFHDWTTTEGDAFLVRTDQAGLPSNLLERAIGVIYRPDTERTSHWFHADLADQFDAVIHIDHTHALHPLERTPLWDMGEPPETYPTGL
jgi:erythromycin esterase-like protein